MPDELIPGVSPTGPEAPLSGKSETDGPDNAGQSAFSGYLPAPDTSQGSVPEGPGVDERADIIPISRVICPHLGLDYDSTVVAAGPTEAHVCFARAHRFRPDVAYQNVYCFGGRFASCQYYVEATEAALHGHSIVPRTTGGQHRPSIAWSLAVAALVVLGILAFSYRHEAMTTLAALLPARAASNSEDAQFPSVVFTATPDAALVPPETSGTPESATESPVTQHAVNLLPTVTPDAQDVTLMPQSTGVGWWTNGDRPQRIVGDSFLYSGREGDQTYVSAVRFDLRRVARGAPIRNARLLLTGIRDDRLGEGSDASWLIQLVAENDLEEIASADYAKIAAAPASITLSPVLGADDVGVDTVNEWSLDAAARDWLYQQITDGATSVILRISPFSDSGEGVFAWDSGQGSESKGNSPQLVLGVGAPPPTPPPTATRPVIVATFTPEPQNVITVAAREVIATEVASNTGTPTPTPVSVVTPTPFPANLATLQAAALAEGLPAVVLYTPVPANNATATENASYATAVALTTGTFTPVPTGFVTPALIFPSPPPENVATAAARALAATAVAGRGDPTATLPWNAVLAEYVIATATPGNAETAVAQIQDLNAAIAATGTPTPQAWNVVVITLVPQPTPTPIPLVVDATTIPPTPTPTATRELTSADLDGFRNKILFKSDRSGKEETWAMDPATGEILSLVTDNRLHDMASERYLAYSPDGKQRAFVQPGGSGELQIFVEDIEYGSFRQLTDLGNDLGVINYDPAWSPLGDRIAFVSTISFGDEVYTVGVDGQNLQRLTNNTWEWDKHPTWSPDGSQIAFYSNRDSGRRQIWIMSVDGSNQRNLSSNAYNDWDPVWVR